MSPDASWSLNPGPIFVLALVTVAYVVRWRRSGESAGRLALFLAGVTCMVAALISPIDRLGEQLFLMHMVQHLLLLDIAPILMILGLTRVLLRPVTRQFMPLEQRLGWLAHPVAALVLYVVVMWAWHVPALYDAANRNAVVHVVEHLLFSVAGFAYWWHVLSPIRARMRLQGLGPAGYMAGTKVFVGLLGVILTFAPATFYGFYEEQPEFWGLSAQEDQAIGGLLMAVEQSVVMGIALAYLFIRMLSESEREEQRAERYAEGREGASAP